MSQTAARAVQSDSFFFTSMRADRACKQVFNFSSQVFKREDSLRWMAIDPVVHYSPCSIDLL
jgi:hypothetical protein